VLALVKPDAFGGVPSADYYVEARIRPMANSTTGNKQLYLVARYVDAGNWYGAGLNVQSSTTSTQVEIAKMLANGTLSRPKQVKAPIAMDAQFYTVRFEMIGSTLTVYLDGKNLGSVTDASFAQRGLIGLYTANKSFQIDDVRVGDPRQKPVQLTLDPAATHLHGRSGRCAFEDRRHGRHGGRRGRQFHRRIQQSGRRRRRGNGQYRHAHAAIRRHRQHRLHERLRALALAHDRRHHRRAIRPADADVCAAGRQQPRRAGGQRSTSTRC
jgi:hypothetical protein